MKQAYLFIPLVCMSFALQAQTVDDDKAFKKKKEEETVLRTVPMSMDSVTNKVCYKEIVNAPKSTQGALFEKMKKWLTAKNSAINPYVITYENTEEGTIIGKGTFTLPGNRRKYVVQFEMQLHAKANRFKYEFTNVVVQFTTAEGSSYINLRGFGNTSKKKEETVEYSLETFYPSRVNTEKPVIKGFEEINADSFVFIDKELVSVCNSLKQSVASKEDW